ncbi:Rhophilin, Rho GTPase binding protein [Cichlidogyrus casuarinus]|uniref:Rhophilin, Rho GTPase binding protein n=1 Tax=Cichlidogyrus casuarinus TaxID=1844966 RepID=A0ABD2Q0V1_9PLAT
MFKKEIKKYDDMFVKTAETDNKVLTNYNRQEQFIEKLSLSPGELTELVSNTSVGSSSPMPKAPSQLVDSIKSIISKLDSIKSDRNDLIVQMQAIQLPDSLRQTYLEKFKQMGPVMDADDTAREAINPCLEGPRGCVRESLDSQKELLDQLQQASTAYFGKSGAISDARSTLLTNLVLAAEEYPQLMKDFTEGLKFYADVTNVLLKIQQKVDDFVFARKTEKDELMNDISTNLSKAVTETAPEPPANRELPARPPPPVVAASTAPPYSVPQPESASCPYPQQPTQMPQYSGVPYPYSKLLLVSNTFFSVWLSRNATNADAVS